MPDNNRYKLLALSPQDMTQSGDHYDPAVLARATQYDSIIEKAAVSAAVEPNLLRAVIVVESGFNSRAVSKTRRRGIHAADAGHGDPLRRLEPATIRSRTCTAAPPT